MSLKGMCILKGIHWREHKANREAREECQQVNTKPTEKQGKSVNSRQVALPICFARRTLTESSSSDLTWVPSTFSGRLSGS
ncbi:hypothetical protein LSAT2_007914 [Lamellibrachia satsuma]|nr:hypothetical protein LSAT2_007914 [Lamellibrachia satsuma]